MSLHIWEQRVLKILLYINSEIIYLRTVPPGLNLSLPEQYSKPIAKAELLFMKVLCQF